MNTKIKEVMSLVAFCCVCAVIFIFPYGCYFLKENEEPDWQCRSEIRITSDSGYVFRNSAGIGKAESQEEARKKSLEEACGGLRLAEPGLSHCINENFSEMRSGSDTFFGIGDNYTYSYECTQDPSKIYSPF